MPTYFKLADGTFTLVYAGETAPEGATEVTEAEFLAGVFAGHDEGVA